MKTIVLIPVKNEDWILGSTLKNIAPFVDHVIIADQNSTDETVRICQEFANVIVVKNELKGHSNQVRWLLLDEARKIADNSLIICIDADEIISPDAIVEMKKAIETKQAIPGDVFRFRWIQLWKSNVQYMNDGAWRDSYKNIAFIDNKGINEYKKDFVINDHTSRVPDTNIGKEILVSYPLLHFQFVPWQRNQLKQAWYRCSELINGARNAKRINNTYRVTMLLGDFKIHDVESRWINNLELPDNLDNVTKSWHLNEIIGFFDKYGIEFFEDLQIWHVTELSNEFIARVGRQPKSKTYPAWLSKMNDIVNIVKNFRLRK